MQIDNHWLYLNPEDEGGGGEGGEQEAPAPISLSDDALVALEEGAEPVKWGEYKQGLIPKSELTRMRQSDSEKVRQQAEQLAQRQIQQYMAMQQQQQQKAPQNDDPYAGLPPQVVQKIQQVEARDGYLDAKSFAEIAKHFTQGQQVGAQQMAQIRDGLQGFLRSQAEEQQHRKISDTLMGLQKKHSDLFDGDEGFDYLDAMYHGMNYDGDPGEYNQFFEGRIEKLKKMFVERVQKMQKAKAEEARANAVPGKGGNYAPKMDGGKPEDYESWAERAFSEMMAGNRQA